MSIFRRLVYLRESIFPNDQCMTQNYEWVKDPFKIQDITMDFNVINTIRYGFRFYTAVNL